PTVRRVALGGPGHRLVGSVDRHWDLFVMAVPPALLLLLAFAFGVARAPVMVALLLVVAALGYVVVSMVGHVVASLAGLLRIGRGARSPGHAMAESRPAYQWSIPLLHQVDS